MNLFACGLKVTRDVSGEKLPGLPKERDAGAAVRSWRSRHGLAESFHLHQVRAPDSKAVKNGSRKGAAPEQGPQAAMGTFWAKAQMRCRPPSHLPSTVGCAVRPLPLIPASLPTLTAHLQLHGTHITAAQALIRTPHVLIEALPSAPHCSPPCRRTDGCRRQRPRSWHQPTGCRMAEGEGHRGGRESDGQSTSCNERWSAVLPAANGATVGGMCFCCGRLVFALVGQASLARFGR